MGLGEKIKSIIWPSGIPVYLEDDGTIFGYVIGKEGSDENKIYKIKSDVGAVEIPADSVIITKKALIYRPPWSKEVEDFIEKLENEKSVNPDLELALSGGNIGDERIREIIERGKEYKRMIEERYKGFKEMREKNIREMQYLMQKRMANAIEKGEYVKEMNELRKKIKILELNIKEAEKILAKIDYPVFTPKKIENAIPVAVPVAAGGIEREEEKPSIDKKRVKKLRVLKVEADLISLQSRLKNKSVISTEDLNLELTKIDEELNEINKILKTPLSPSVREYFEKRRDELLRRKDELRKRSSEEKKEPVIIEEEKGKEEKKEEGGEKKEEEEELELIESTPEKKEKKKDLEELEELISNITEE